MVDLIKLKRDEKYDNLSENEIFISTNNLYNTDAKHCYIHFRKFSNVILKNKFKYAEVVFITQLNDVKQIEIKFLKERTKHSYNITKNNNVLQFRQKTDCRIKNIKRNNNIKYDERTSILTIELAKIEKTVRIDVELLDPRFKSVNIPKKCVSISVRNIKDTGKIHLYINFKQFHELIKNDYIDVYYQIENNEISKIVLMLLNERNGTDSYKINIRKLDRMITVRTRNKIMAKIKKGHYPAIYNENENSLTINLKFKIQKLRME